MANVVLMNQGGGLLFRELVVAVAEEFGPVVYISRDAELQTTDSLKYVPAPRYNNSSYRSRIVSWTRYSFSALRRCLTEPGKPVLFMVTNPPVLPWLGVLVRMIRRRRYVILVWDVYPDSLECFAGVSERSLVSRFWRRMNRRALGGAERVITISPQMAARVEKHMNGAKHASIDIVPTWVDTDQIRPVPKSENWFAREHGQVDKLTVLYSGNLGLVHDLSMLPEVADRLRDVKDVHFVIVGGGPGRAPIEQACASRSLENITFLPFQDEATLPYSLATADVAMVSIARGAEGISMPSKTYNMMAAGAAILGFSSRGSDLCSVIDQHDCGTNVEPGDISGVVEAIERYRGDRELLDRHKRNARKAAEAQFSKRVCLERMLGILRDVMAQ